jgi:hypothetical protein
MPTWSAKRPAQFIVGAWVFAVAIIGVDATAFGSPGCDAVKAGRLNVSAGHRDVSQPNSRKTVSGFLVGDTLRIWGLCPLDTKCYHSIGGLSLFSGNGRRLADVAIYVASSSELTYRVQGVDEDTTLTLVIQFSKGEGYTKGECTPGGTDKK